MKKAVELPIIEPMYSTYHHQGICTSIIKDNPSIKNWVLNEVMHLICTRSFLKGYSTPEINIFESNYQSNPYIEWSFINVKYLAENANRVFKAFIDDGYYIAFYGFDDFYISGKSMYKERHYYHDGLICGYDDNEKTFTLYAYDEKWVYRSFKTRQADINRSKNAALKSGMAPYIYAIKAKKDVVDLCPERILENIKQYLNSSFDNYPVDGKGKVKGIVVHEYIIMYLNKLIDGSIQYKMLDWRVFRLLWEHKKVMLDRIKAVEEKLNFDNAISKEYEEIVEDYDNMRMLYAHYHKRRRDSILSSLVVRLKDNAEHERKLLTILEKKMEKVI